MRARRIARTTRRQFLTTTAAATSFTALGGIRPPLHQPRQRPAAGQPRRAVRRYRGRFRHGLGARRPAGAHAGRDGDHRQLQGHPHKVAYVDALPESDFTAKLLIEEPARRPGHLLPRRFQDLAAPTIVGEPRGRPLPHRAGRPALDHLRLVGRYRRPRLGHRRVARRHAHLRDDAEEPSRLLHPQRRQHLRRRRRSRPSRRCRTAKSGRTSSPRKSRSRPKRSPNSAAPTNTICSTRICAPSTPRCPSSRNGTTTRSFNNWWPGEPMNARAS